MTRDEGLLLLANAPCDDQASRVNPSLPRRVAVEIITAFVKSEKGPILSAMAEKRVLQVSQDRKHPKPFVSKPTGEAKGEA